MKRRQRGTVHPKGKNRIAFTTYYFGQRFRPISPIIPTESNLRRARQRVRDMYARIDAGTLILSMSFQTTASEEQVRASGGNAAQSRFEQ